jgi:hypothetical protein
VYKPLDLRPVTLRRANAHVAEFHRHNKPVRGHLFSVAVHSEGELVGVAILGRPVSRVMDDGQTAEVLRCCVAPGAPKNVPSMLYAALWRAWRAVGGRKALTYTLQSEGGASLRAAGWKPAAVLPPRDAAGWTNRGKGREAQDVVAEPKIRWEVEAACAA